MHHSKHFNSSPLCTIRDDEGRAGDDQFPGSFDAAKTPKLGMPREHRDGFLYAFNETDSRGRIFIGNIFVRAIQVPDRKLGPKDLHLALVFRHFANDSATFESLANTPTSA